MKVMATEETREDLRSEVAMLREKSKNIQFEAFHVFKVSMS